MRRRTVWLAVLLLLFAGAGLLIWYGRRPPGQDARSLLESLPPNADAYAVADMDVLQSNPAVKHLLADPPGAAHSADYQQLLRDSGFQYQRDLRRFAFAVFGSDWAGVAIADVDRQRFVSYLESQGAVKSQSHGRTLYTFGTARPFRLAFLDDKRLAFAVGPDASRLEDVLDRATGGSGQSAKDDLASAGALNRYPQDAGLWVFARMDRFAARNPQGPGIGSLQLGQDWLQGSRTLVGSVVSSALHLDVHLENQCDSADSAQHMAAGFRALVAILKAVQPPKGDPRPDYTPLLAAIRIDEQANAVHLDWSWNPSMIALLTKR